MLTYQCCEAVDNELQTVQTEIENTLNDKETPEEAVQKMADTINASIEDYNLLNE